MTTQKTINNFGCNTNCECGKTTKEILTNIKTAGFSHVMVAAINGDFEEALKEALKLGLNVPYVHLNPNNASNLWLTGDVNKKYIEDVCKELELCGKYNVPIAVTHATSCSVLNLPIPPNKQGVKSMKEILKAAEKYNVKIALENTNKPDIKSFKYLLNSIDSPWLGFCYDAGHNSLYNSKNNLIKKYGSRILAVHLHDNFMNYKKGEEFYQRDLHLLPFDGNIDFNKVCKRIASSPYDNVIMLELHKYNCDKVDIYDKLMPLEYLTEAIKRAEQLEGIINLYRKRSNYDKSYKSTKTS